MKKFLENFQSGYKYKVDRISAYLIQGFTFVDNGFGNILFNLIFGEI